MSSGGKNDDQIEYKTQKIHSVSIGGIRTHSQGTLKINEKHDLNNPYQVLRRNQN